MAKSGRPVKAVARHDLSETMDKEEMIRLKEMHLAPYIQLATSLIGKRRRSGGNMFRHQIDTMGTLMDYGYIDSVLLKASLVHDILEDIPDFERDKLVYLDEEGGDVFKLVLEVTRRPVEKKEDFLTRILEFGSPHALVLKSADRISNMISLGYTIDVAFIQRYADETERYIYPIAERANHAMFLELQELVSTRRSFLAQCFEI
jgi:(p)ppGpp synthase/HD superfamily hydrolase